MAKVDSHQEGDLAEVFSHGGEKLGVAMLAKGRSIVGHMIAFGEETVKEAISKRIKEAAHLRKRWFDSSKTNAVRLINAEGDQFPGLIVDAYDDVLVMQVSHAGIEKLKPLIVEELIQQLKPKSLYEKSTSFLRKKEGLNEIKALVYGEDNPEVVVLENGLQFSVNVIDGQKTGLFLDQREMRALVRELSAKRKVLNCFSYTGGFSLAALVGKASSVDSVEISAKCGPKIEKNLELNALDQFNNHRFLCQDAFEFLKEAPFDYDFVILDPPAFVKKREDIANAFRAYKEINRKAMEKMPSGSLLLTCSCSYHVDETLFQNILFRAALESKRNVKILSRHRQALDHPISIFHPESAYLKSFLLYIE